MKLDEVVALEYIEKSPAGFDVYYDNLCDRIIKVKGSKMVTYSDRKEGTTGKKPCFFNNVEISSL